jgi:glycosyltransferase involved in cell wall biosynthesis
VVLSTTPHFNVVESAVLKQPLTKHFAGLFFTSNFSGIKVYHVPQKKFKSTLLRLIGFVWWHLLSFFLGLFQKNVNVIISPSPPLTIGIINIVLAKLKRAKVIYNVQEIYPDLLIEEGGLKSNVVINTLKKMESFVYNSSDAVCTIDQVFQNTIITRFKNPEKLQLIPNFVDSELYKPIEEPDISGFTQDLKQKLMSLPIDFLKIVYAGNIGHAQDWDMLINIASKTRESKVAYFVIGEGVAKLELEKKISVHSLDNIHLFPYQPREVMPQVLAVSDIQYIFMTPRVEGHGFPSKVYTIMACAKPLLISSGKASPIVNFLRDKNCSFIVDNFSMNEREDSIVDFVRTIDKATLVKMGFNGLKTIHESYTKEIVTQQYINLINNVIS